MLLLQVNQNLQGALQRAAPNQAQVRQGASHQGFQNDTNAAVVSGEEEWSVVTPDTKLTGKYINHGVPLPVTLKLDLGDNVWIVGLVGGGYLKMVKIRITGSATYTWIATRYDASFAESCSVQATFTEECFKGRDVDRNFYTVSLVAQPKLDKDQGPCNAENALCISGLTCVTQGFGTWSQCIDCSPGQFPYSCEYWADELRAAAVEACGMSCDAKPVVIKTVARDQGPCHASVTKCESGLTCVTQADRGWSQCIDCSTDSFPYSCGYWGPQLLTAAEAACSATCEK
eukprot:CAMPEP_0179040150 /NCGR_PEP_ID=MMETSP0796-20121207/15500_1 /TAXON_ID=73915 /ORGANISM="Pyrodinium bahamense, Strain pbaha01" /LENGTH=286 /DNA_ID=CAMNT_0020736489 /DNA_START=1 /DNA_END=861 /DNA_ORIENTATION=+